MNAAQQEILAKLRYRSFLSYNQLWEKQGNSSKFTYHLKALKQKGLVEKKNERYTLTSEGIKTVDYLTLKSSQPLIVVIVVPKRNDTVLVTTREKYPYKGYEEFCSSKIQHHETLEEAARDRLLKIGLRGNVTYKGIEFIQTKENNHLVMHHHLHIFLADNPQGMPKRGQWIAIHNFQPQKPIPHFDQTLKIALHDGFSIAVTDLMKEGEEFTKYKTLSFKTFKTH